MHRIERGGYPWIICRAAGLKMPEKEAGERKCMDGEVDLGIAIDALIRLLVS